MDVAKYKDLFVSETREYLQGMSQQVLLLQSNPTDEIYEFLFRAAHSIKGMAASMGFGPMRDAAHHLEEAFDGLRKTRAQITEEMVGLLFNGLDLLGGMIEQVHEKSAIDEESVAGSLALFSAMVKRAQPGAMPVDEEKPTFEILPSESEIAQPVPEEESQPLFEIKLRVSDDASLPAARAIVALKRLEDFGKITNLLPPMDDILHGNFDKVLSCVLLSTYSVGDILDALNDLADIENPSVVPILRTVPVEESLTAGAAEVPGVLKQTTIRVETRKLDQVMENIGELLILNAVLQETYSATPQLSLLNTLTKRLYEDFAELRTLPFEFLSGTFPRTVFELGQKLGKKVNIKIQGAELQMDKSILSELADPLIHILRNAVDHGIELPSARMRAGKSEQGLIQIQVEKQGDRILIRVEDDGKGIDPQQIKKAAIRKGIISERAASFLNQQELLLLITRHGFSTAQQVSDISGRGVGLDVVREKIDALGGSFSIYSVPGQFTRFDIVVPFTVAIISAQLIRCRNLIYAIPTSRIERFTLIEQRDVHYTQGRPVVFSDNSTIYLEDLHSLLTHTPLSAIPPQTPGFITEHQNRKIAWCVDELLNEKQIMIKSFGKPVDLLGCYSGATVLGKGEVVPVLDVEHLYREKYSEQYIAGSN